MTPAAVEAAGLIKSFRARDGRAILAVRDVDLTIHPGEIVALLGPNGAGKTTALDMILGLTDPTAGRVRVLGLEPRLAVRAGRVSAVLQTGGLLNDISVRETVEMVASTYRQHAPVQEVLTRAGLAPLADRRVSKCSGGEQQRLRFALALLPDPDVLILDEPTAGMDVGARHDFWDTMRRDARSGRTVIFATHYLEEADAFADRIVLLARGALVADGSTEQIRAAAGGKVVSATFPAAGLATAVAVLQALRGVDSVETRGTRVSVRTTDSDAVARTILVDLDGADVEIASARLDQAFLALTDHPAESGATA